jgi:hypothetical protein
MPKPAPPLPEQHTRTDTYRGVELQVLAERQPTGRWVWFLPGRRHAARARVGADTQARLVSLAGTTLSDHEEGRILILADA